MESLETFGKLFWKLSGNFWKTFETFEKLWELLETFCNFGNFGNFGNAKDFFDMLLGCGEPAFGVRGTRPGRLGEPGRAHPRGTGPEEKRAASH